MSFSQGLSYYPLGNVKFFHTPGKALSNPLTGGFTAPQFQTLDVNLDGKEDIIVFDRTTRNLGTVMPFIDTGFMGSPIYVYRPEFAARFPKVRDWMILVDYNRDGLKDIFTGDNSYIDVYKNTTKKGKVEFQKIHDNLCDTDFYSKGYCSWMYSQSGNLPAITDFDGDGDVDFIALNIIGGYFSYYKNQQVEAGLPMDSLAFKWVDDCWGSLQLSFTKNDADLGISCEKWYPKQAAHLGSSICVSDLDGDGDAEMIHGDVGYSNLIMLKNGRKEYSWPWDTIVSVDTAYPSYNVKADILNFPAAFILDADKDGLRDLIVAPSDYEQSENKNHVLFYQNTASHASPRFEYRKNTFLTEDMIDFGKQAAPLLWDINHDGLMDLLVSASGAYSISRDSTSFFHLYLNEGTSAQAQFVLKDTNYLNAASRKLRWAVPALGDIDRDSDTDLLVGQAFGRIAFFENIAGPGNKPNLVFSTDFLDSIQRSFSTMPLVMDLDQDTFPDLLIGEHNGTISWFEKSATPPHKFEWVRDSLCKINVSDSFFDTGTNTWMLRSEGMAAPVLADLNHNGEYDLLVGNMTGKVYYYPDFQKYLNDSARWEPVKQFNSMLDSFVTADFQARIIPAVGLLDGDTIPDALFGLWRGGLLGMGSRNIKDSVPIGTSVEEVPLAKLHIYPNPAKEELFIQWETNGKRKADWTVYDLRGAIVAMGEFHQGSSLSLSVQQWPEGIYIVQIREGDVLKNAKFSVLH